MTVRANPPSPEKVGHTTRVDPLPFSNSGVGSFKSHKNQREQVTFFNVVKYSSSLQYCKYHYFTSIAVKNKNNEKNKNKVN